MSSLFTNLTNKLKKICEEHHILNEPIIIKARALNTKEAIGSPKGNDFPIQKGKEKLMQAQFKNGTGQAFTDMFYDFNGSVLDVINLKKESNYERAVFICSLNAILNHLGLVSKTIHCKDNAPYSCATQLSLFLESKKNVKKICLIGYQPAFIAELSKKFELRVIDLDEDNINSVKYNIKIEDESYTQNAVEWSDIIIATGTTLANNTIESFPKNKTVFYGTTIAGAAYLENYERFCEMSS